MQTGRTRWRLVDAKQRGTRAQCPLCHKQCVAEPGSRFGLSGNSPVLSEVFRIPCSEFAREIIPNLEGFDQK